MASSTGNITGIYDIAGGTWEMTASYITNGNTNLSYGATANGIPPLVAQKTVDANGYQTLSTKYTTVYPYASNDSIINNYATYKNLSYGYGDAILETSSAGDNNTSWFEDHSKFLYSTNTFLVRGGRYHDENGAGTFAFSNYPGFIASNVSMRVVLGVV